MKFADMTRYIERHASGCPVPTITNALRDAAIELCNDAECWKKELTPLYLRKQSEYILKMPDNTELMRIERMEHMGEPVLPKSKDWLDKNYPAWREAQSNWAHYYYLKFNDKSQPVVRLVPYPPETIQDRLYIDVIIKPTDSATEIDDFIATRYRKALEYGALGEVLMMKDKLWTDAERALLYQEKFGTKVAEARVDASKDFTNKSTFIEPNCIEQGWP